MQRNGKVYIIGAGPGGLTAAWYLAKKGHDVTIFDAQPAAGGTARYGIPSYRVPTEVVDREVAEVATLGVKFEFGHKVENLDGLFNDGFDAVFIAIGCQSGDRLRVPRSPRTQERHVAGGFRQSDFCGASGRSSDGQPARPHPDRQP